MSPGKAGPLEFVIQQISDATNAFALTGTPLSAQQKMDIVFKIQHLSIKRALVTVDGAHVRPPRSSPKALYCCRLSGL
jgi:hypothetical protein